MDKDATIVGVKEFYYFLFRIHTTHLITKYVLKTVKKPLYQDFHKTKAKFLCGSGLDRSGTNRAPCNN